VSNNWRAGNQEFGNERSIPVYKKLLAGFQIGILPGAKCDYLRTSFIKQQIRNFEKSQELMGQSEKFKTSSCS
jgi:hypothetical protein